VAAARRSLVVVVAGTTSRCSASGVVGLSVAQWLVATIDRNRGVRVWQSRSVAELNCGRVAASVSRGLAHVFKADVT
jgi:hypothetical protein